MEKGFSELKLKMEEYGLLVEHMVRDGVRGLVERDRGMLQRVLEEMEERADRMELEIEEMCISFIATQQPRAKLLRTVMMIYKINNDLERIGDLATSIAEASLYLLERPQLKPLVDLPRMAEITVEMLSDALRSFFDEDQELALKVLRQDDTVDALRDQISRELVTYMASDPSTIDRAMQILRISRSLERIADLATNISEDAVFAVSGSIIRHRMY